MQAAVAKKQDAILYLWHGAWAVWSGDRPGSPGSPRGPWEGGRIVCSLGAPMPSVPDAVGPSASGEELVGQEGPGPEAPGHGRLQQDLRRRGRRRKVVPLLFCAPGPPKQHPAAPLEAKALPGSKQSRGHQPGQKALPGRPCLGQPLCVPGSGFAALQTLPTPTVPLGCAGGPHRVQGPLEAHGGRVGGPCC